MSRIVVLGAGVCGLASAMMLARDGHDVLVLERDSGWAPDTPQRAWASWERPGVTQFRLGHLLLPAGRAVLEAELPEVIASLSAAGAARVDFLARMPPTIADRTPRPGDERFVTLTARRPVLEQVLARLAQQDPGVEVRRGVAVRGLTSTPRGTTPHVTGVRTDSGEEIAADLVLDATGRRSRLPHWLRDVGARPVQEESEDSGFIYYQRTFRCADGTLPRMIAPVGSPIGTMFLVTLPADNGTWAVVIATSSADQPLKRLRDPQVWTSVVRACPLHAHWLEGEPITGVEAMGGLTDRCRRFAPNGRPVATGVAAVADAWACTNPSLGRGITHGLRHAQRLRDVAREHLQDPAAFALAWEHVTETESRPYYEDVIAENRLRRDEIDALRNDLEPPTPDSRAARLLAAVPHDPDVFRAYLETRAGLATMREVVCRPALTDRIDQLAIPARTPLPGPDRSQLLELLADGAADKPHRARPGVKDVHRRRNAVPAHPTEDDSGGRNAELVRRYFEVVWNRGDLAAVDEFFGDEFTNFGRRGADARALIRAIVAAWRTAFPDLRFEIEEEIVGADAVVHRVTCTGTHLGTFEHPAVGVLEPSRRSFAVDHMHIHRVRDGRIVQHWGTRNDLAMLKQLGAEVRPPRELPGPAARGRTRPARDPEQNPRANQATRVGS